MYKLETLENDRRAEFFHSPWVDRTAYYPKFLVIGVYRGIEDKIIIQYDTKSFYDLNTKVNLYKIYHDNNIDNDVDIDNNYFGDGDYIKVYGEKYYLKNFR